MSEDVISLTSSDDESPEPPPKRMKIAPAPQVTLTLVPNSKKKSNPIETVTLDSDDDLDHSRTQPNLVSEKLKNSGKVDLITLTDDEEDISHSNEVNNVNAIISSIFSSDTVEILSVATGTNSVICQDKSETVSIIDSDGENELSTENHVQPIEDICKKSFDTTVVETNVKEGNENLITNNVNERVEVTKENSADTIKDSNSIECQDKSNTVSITDSDSENELNTVEKVQKTSKESANSNENIADSTVKEVPADAKEINGSSDMHEDKDIIKSITDSDIIEIINEPNEEAKNCSLVAHHNKDITLTITDSDNETELIAKKQPAETTCKESTDTNENTFVKASISEPNKDSPENHVISLDEVTKETNKNTTAIEENDDNNIKETDIKAVTEELDQETTKKGITELKNPSLDSKSDESPEESQSIEDDLLNVSRVEINENKIMNESKIKRDHYENELTVNTDTSSNDIPGPSTSLIEEPVIVKNKTFKKFLKIVEEKIVDSTFEEILPKKLPIIEKYFKKCGTYVNETIFEKLLNDCIETVRDAPNSNAANTAVLSFHKIFEHLKSHVTETSIEIELDHLPKVKKLEKTMKLLIKRIKILEEAEVDFDDEEDSAYMILDRYEARLSKVYAKYCEYIRRNPFSGRAVYDRISFVHSKYNAINQAISKKYRNSVTFPSYYELEKYIGKVSKKEKLDLSDSEIKREAKKCFKYLGSVLQKKRRQELYDSHLGFIESTEDPANKDISLENLLKKNYSEGKEKIEKLYQKYVDKQEQGEDHISSDGGETSEDSDSDSKKESSKKVKKKDKRENGSFTENTGEKENKPNEVQDVNATEASENREIVKKKAPHVSEQDIKEVLISDKNTDENLQNANVKET